MRGNQSAFDDGFEMCIEEGIPEDGAADLAGTLCCSPYGEGPCASESASTIKSAAEKYQVTSQTSPTPTYAQIALIAMFGLFIAAFMVQMARSGDASLQRNYEGIRAEMRRAQ